MSKSIRDIRIKFLTIKHKIRRTYRKLTCKHERTVQFYPGEVICNLPNGSRIKHKTIMITGCLNCGKTKMVDYGE